MTLLENTLKYYAHSEEEAKEAKGEIIGEAWVVSVTQIFASLWEYL